MAFLRRATAGVILLASVLAAAGCSASGGSVGDADIVSALHLHKAGSAYEMDGNPFCRIDQLLNDVSEVNEAQRQKSRDQLVIAAPNGEAGIVVHTPFAPPCKRQAEAALKRLVRPANKSG